MRLSRWAGMCSAATIALSAAVIATVVVAPAASATSVAPTAAVATVAPAPDWVRSAPNYRYYLSLGDSLGFGYSAANLAKFETDHNPADFAGYTQILAADLHLTGSTTNLSCPGESTLTMLGVGGKTCPAANSGYGTWPYSGSQMAAATAFLKSRPWWDRGLITLSIGANDVLPIAATCLTNPSCPDLAPALKTMRNNLSTILGKLRSAAPFATIVVLAPYNPFGHAYPASNIPAAAVDLSIAAVALLHFDPVADAFVPINVNNASTFDCGNLVYFCTSPANFDVHPTGAGYAVIANAFEAALR
ncbi:MAG: hypothetical protein J0I11_08275 [Actinobacteria bacterium]|nr:hypothetical protein [Actinomycetota bacterium]